MCLSNLNLRGAGLSLKEIVKVWGKEVIIVNCDEYCGKYLCIDKGAESSYHYHKEKKETFLASRGTVTLRVQDMDYILTPTDLPITIEPLEAHSFYGVTDATILEVSTHHSDEDVVRIKESKGA